MPNTIHLYRVFKAPVERVFRAWVEADAYAKWIAPHGFACSIDQFEAHTGGSFKMAFRNLTTGEAHSFGGKFLTVVPNELIKATDAFDDPNLPGTMVTTTEFRSTPMGTEVKITQENIPDMIPPEACHLGWQESLQLLALLVEPEIRM